MTCPVDLYDRVVGTEDLGRTREDIVETANEHEWRETSDQIEAALTTPLGFTLSLSYLPR